MKDLLDAYKGANSTQKRSRNVSCACSMMGVKTFSWISTVSARIGFPEVIFAEGKTTEQVIAIAKSLFEKNGHVFVSVIDEEKEIHIRHQFARAEVKKAGRLLLIKRHGLASRKIPGRIGIITAGTADVPFAQESALILEELGI